MSPTTEERLATLEAEKSHDKDFQREVRETLRLLPGRVAKRTKRQIEACQQKNGVICGKKVAAPATVAAAETDYKNMVKILMLCVFVGGIIGGAIYQYKNPDKSLISIAQEGSK